MSVSTKTKPVVMPGARSILIVSLGANLLLAGWLVAKVAQRGGPPSAQATPGETAAAAPAQSAPRVLRTNLVEVITNVVDAPGFRWALIETNDFRAYAANLRAIGCPQNTVAHILLPDIEKTFDRRERQLAAVPEPFWQNARQSAARQRERERSQHAAKAERAALLLELTGNSWSASAREMWVDEEEVFFTMGFLSDEKVMPVLGLAEKIGNLGEGFLDETRGAVSDEDIAGLREASRAFQREALGHLTPSEAEELALRGFEAMQDELFDEEHRNRGVELSGHEYRELLRLATQGRDWVSDVLVAALAHEEDDLEKIGRERPENFEQAARALLGDQRFADYQRAQDKDFHKLLDAADSAKLPESAAVRAYDVRLSALGEAQALATNADSLTPELRRQALDAIHEASAQVLVEILGPKQGAESAKDLRRAVERAAKKGQ